VIALAAVSVLAAALIIWGSRPRRDTAPVPAPRQDRAAWYAANVRPFAPFDDAPPARAWTPAADGYPYGDAPQPPPPPAAHAWAGNTTPDLYSRARPYADPAWGPYLTGEQAALMNRCPEVA